MSEKALTLLGLMRKANAVQVGEDNTASAAKDGKARLLVLACDASDNAKARAESFTRGHSAPLINLPYTKDELAANLGLGGCSMAAVTDLGFANALVKELVTEHGEEYSPAADELAAKYEKARRRKAEAQIHKQNKRNGKRRTNI